MPNTPSLRLIAAALLAPTAALAHPGDHAQGSFIATLAHVFAAPDHLALLAAAVVVVALVLWLRRGRAE